jgi:hypothetical protein
LQYVMQALQCIAWCHCHPIIPASTAQYGYIKRGRRESLIVGAPSGALHICIKPDLIGQTVRLKAHLQNHLKPEHQSHHRMNILALYCHDLPPYSVCTK